MTTIALVGVSRSLPEGLESSLSEDRIVRVEHIGLLDHANEVEIAVGTGSAPQLLHEVVMRSPRLRWLHLTSAGVDLALVSEARGRPDLVLTNSSGSFDAPVSEFVLAVMLAAAKRIPAYRSAQLRSRWDTTLENADLHGSTLVVLGLGSIGSAVAHLASALGMRIIGVRRHPGASDPPVSKVVGPEALSAAASDADFLVITAPLTSATRGLVSREVLMRMKPTAWIINVARGEIVDEAALFEALDARALAGAALDVWWTEPLRSDSKWWRLENVIATPHAASSSPTLRKRTLDLFLENLRRWKAGEALLNVVDPHAGY